MARKASSTQASAMPRVLLAMVPASCEIGSATLNARITSAIPTSMVVGMLIRVSTSHLALSLRIRRCSTQGRSSTLSTKVSAAE